MAGQLYMDDLRPGLRVIIRSRRFERHETLTLTSEPTFMSRPVSGEPHWWINTDYRFAESRWRSVADMGATPYKEDLWNRWNYLVLDTSLPCQSVPVPLPSAPKPEPSQYYMVPDDIWTAMGPGVQVRRGEPYLSQNALIVRTKLPDLTYGAQMRYNVLPMWVPIAGTHVWFKGHEKGILVEVRS